MTEPTDEFEDVLGALAATTPAAGPRGVEAMALALAEPVLAERARGVDGAIARDADEAWSFAVAFLGDEEAAWQAVVSGFAALGRGECAAVTAAESLRAVAAASLEVWRLLAKAGATHDVLGGALPPEQRLAILLRAGLRLRDVVVEGAGDPSEALVAAFPQPGHPRGDELCRLVARELLGALEPGRAEALAALRRDHPTSAALIRARYAELAEVPLLVLARRDELAAAVRAQLAREAAQRERVGAVRLRITVGCSFCHDGLAREEAVFCAGCLAPHHQECFMTHGKCSVHGCGQTQVVKAGAAVSTDDRHDRTDHRRRGRRAALAGTLLLLAGLGGAAAWQELAEGPDRPPGATIDPAVLLEAEARTAEAEARRAEAAARRDALASALEARKVSLHLDRTPFVECVDVLRDLSGLNIVISSRAMDLVETEEVTVTLQLRDITFKNALSLVLASHDDLTYRLRDPGLIELQVRSEGGEELLLEVYDLADILSGAARARGGFQVDAGKLIELLLPLSGEESGASAEVSGEVLVLRAAARDHEGARELLGYLRGERSPPGPSSRPAWVDALEAQLAPVTSVTFADAPLGEVVSYLQDVTGANIVVSPTVDQEEARVSLRVHGISHHDALRLVLEQTHLAAAYRNEALLLCPPEEARPPCSLRLLDARDLEGWLPAEALVAVVRSAVGEDRWDAPASIEAHQQQLIVHQTAEGHAEVDQVLAKLRVSRARSQEARSPR